MIGIHKVSVCMYLLVPRGAEIGVHHASS